MRKGIARLLQGYVSPIVEVSIEPLDGIDIYSKTVDCVGGM